MSFSELRDPQVLRCSGRSPKHLVGKETSGLYPANSIILLGIFMFYSIRMIKLHFLVSVAG